MCHKMIFNICTEPHLEVFEHRTSPPLNPSQAPCLPYYLQKSVKLICWRKCNCSESNLEHLWWWSWFWSNFLFYSYLEFSSQRSSNFQVSVMGRGIEENLSPRRDKANVLFGGTKILQHTLDKVIFVLHYISYGYLETNFNISFFLKTDISYENPWWWLPGSRSTNWIWNESRETDADYTIFYRESNFFIVCEWLYDNL